MNDLYDALQKSIYDYMHVNELTPRKKQRMMDVYSKYVYNYETVDNLLSKGKEEDDTEQTI